MANVGILGLFPGQGSQSVGMGRAFFEQSEIARDLFARADRALGFSLSEICFEGPAERLMETAVTQPAILTVSVVCYEYFRLNKPSDAALVAAAGHSLGEYSALVAAGALGFDDAVALVHKRGRYMQEAVPAGQGKMVAVLGKELTDIQDALAKTSQVAEVANINAPGQIVVAGSREGVDEFLAALPGAKAKELAVSAPFHCSLMKPAEENLARDLQAISISDARFPVFANFSAAPLTDAEAIRTSLVQQVCGRVRWVECMVNAIEATQPAYAIEFGAGGVLSGLMRRIDRSVEVRTLAAPDATM